MCHSNTLPVLRKRDQQRIQIECLKKATTFKTVNSQVLSRTYATNTANTNSQKLVSKTAPFSLPLSKIPDNASIRQLYALSFTLQEELK